MLRLDGVAWERVKAFVTASVISYAASLIEQDQPQPTPEYWQNIARLASDPEGAGQGEAEAAAREAQLAADHAVLNGSDRAFGLACAARKLAWAVHSTNDEAPSAMADAVDMAAQAVDRVIYTRRAAHMILRNAQRSALNARKDVWAMAARRLFEAIDDEIDRLPLK